MSWHSDELMIHFYNLILTVSTRSLTYYYYYYYKIEKGFGISQLCASQLPKFAQAFCSKRKDILGYY